MAYTPLPNPWTGIPLVGALIDAIQNALVSVTTAVESLVTTINVKDNGTTVGSRGGIDFIEGTGMGISLADDSGNDDVNVTISTTALLPTLADTKGDILAASGADVFVVVPAGTNDYKLSADSAQTAGLIWTPDYAISMIPYVTRSSIALVYNTALATSDVLTLVSGVLPSGYTTTYNWRRADTGATLGTNSTYTVTSTDALATYQIYCTVTYRDSGGTKQISFDTVKLGNLKYAFVYTGGVQTFTVPVGFSTATVKAWGAGGGGGGRDTASNTGGTAGAGGFVEAAILSVTPGQMHNVYVAGGGSGGAGDVTGTGGGAAGYNGGGAGGNAGGTGASGAGGAGGGWSGIYLPDGTTLVAVAAGGGGGTGGAGGNINVFGKGGNNQTSANGTSTSGLTGTNYSGDGGGGGGTGGGRYGGGTKSPGRADAGGDVTKSDGGLNYVNGTYATQTTSTTGADNSTAGTQTGDPDYVATAGGGGAGSVAGAGGTGQHGRVVVICTS